MAKRFNRTGVVPPREVAEGTPVKLDAIGVQQFILRSEDDAAITGTWHVMASYTHPNSDDWTQVGSDITALMATPIALPTDLPYIRVDCTVYTSGLPMAFAIGERGD